MRSQHITMMYWFGGVMLCLCFMAGAFSCNKDNTTDPISCGGTDVGGFCWYLGPKFTSCATVCTSHGGYHEATRTYAGSEGTDSNCYAVLSALGAAAPTNGQIDQQPNLTTGCSWYDNGGIGREEWYRGLRDTLSTSSAQDERRACACNQ